MHAQNQPKGTTAKARGEGIIETMEIDVVDEYFRYLNGMHHTNDSNSCMNSKLVYTIYVCTKIHSV